MPPPPIDHGPGGRGLPLTPELDRMLDDNTPEAWEAFVEGRSRQIQDYLRSAAARAAPPRSR